VRLLIAIAVCFVAGAAGIQSANAAEPSNEEILAAIQRITEEREEPGDRALVLSVPGLADQIIDPKKTEVSDTPGNGSGDGALPGGVKCSRADRYIVYRSLSGARHFDWHMWARWCYRRGTIYGNPTRGDYIARYDPVTVNLLTPVRNGYEFGPNRVNADAWMQGHVRLCVPRIGCYGNYYPYTRYHLGNNGSYKIEQRK